jgi:hypothetical protein
MAGVHAEEVNQPLIAQRAEPSAGRLLIGYEVLGMKPRHMPLHPLPYSPAFEKNGGARLCGSVPRSAGPSFRFRLSLLHSSA